MKRIFIGLVSALLLSANLLAQQAATGSLTVRNAHAMIYHEARGTVMLFGGADERQVLGDLWEWMAVHGRVRHLRRRECELITGINMFRYQKNYRL